MRLVLRVIGTWLLGLALIVLVVDGTKSLGANQLILTPTGVLWRSLHEQSLEQVTAFFSSRLFASLLENVFAAVLSYPAFAVIGVPGIALALLGRSKKATRYVHQEQL